MFCTNCGNPLEKGSSFCGICGSCSGVIYDPPPPPPRSKWKIGLVAILAAVLLIGGVVFFINSCNEHPLVGVWENEEALLSITLNADGTGSWGTGTFLWRSEDNRLKVYENINGNEKISFDVSEDSLALTWWGGEVFFHRISYDANSSIPLVGIWRDDDGNIIELNADGTGFFTDEWYSGVILWRSENNYLGIYLDIAVEIFFEVNGDVLTLTMFYETRYYETINLHRVH